MKVTGAVVAVASALLVSGCLPGMPMATGYGSGYSYGTGYGNNTGGYGTTWESMVNGPQSYAGMPGAYGLGGGMGGMGGYGMPSKKTLGGMGGAALGGLGGAQIGNGNGKLAAVAGGTLLGWLVGSNIGDSLDKADYMAAQGGFNQSMASNRPVQWQGQNAAGIFQPTRSGQDAYGRVCREYQQTVMIGGKKEKAFGQACQQSDGSWQVVV